MSAWTPFRGTYHAPRKKRPVLTLETSSKHTESGLCRFHPTGVGISDLKRASFPTEVERFRRFRGVRWGADRPEFTGSRFGQ